MTNVQPQLSIIARAPFTVYYEGSADVLSASNTVGRFDILPGHADFFSMLTPDDIIIEPGNGKEPIVIPVSNGIITVRGNEVLLFVNM